MKKISLFRSVVVAFLAFGAASFGFAQNAALTADSTALAAGGGSVALTASASYDGQPGALGWSVALPADWTLVSLSGANVPAIAPEVGTAGTLEFAYTAVPANRAEFTFVVRYPAGSGGAKAAPTVLIRADGKLATVKPTPIEFGGK